MMSKQHKTSTNKQATNRTATPKASHTVGDAARHAMIAEAAYLYAEQRGFQGDAALDDWLRAESEINARLSTSG